MFRQSSLWQVGTSLSGLGALFNLHTRSKKSRVAPLSLLDTSQKIAPHINFYPPKLRPVQPSGEAWREATVRNRKRVAQALCASQDFTGLINNTSTIL